MSIRRSWCVFAFLLLLFSVAAHAAPVKLSTITISPGTVTGGTAATGTATLTGAAPHNGATVTLSSSNAAVAAVPASIFIPQGATSATFSVTTSPVAASTSVTITGNYQATATGSFSVLPPALSGFSVSPTSVMAVLGTSTGTVTLDGAAPAGGQSVALASNNGAATVPASVTVAAGATSASFTITTSAVASSTNVTLTATLAGNTRVATLTVTPCIAPAVNPPSSFPATDINWIDDTLPAGMTATGLTWDTSQKASGAQSATAGNASGFHEVLFTGATATLTVNPSEAMVSYLLVSVCAAPREIVLGWHTTGGSWVKAYYGQSLIGGEAGMVSLGAVPAGGQWLRVQVPASQLGIVGATVDGFDVQTYDGQSWVDRVGKTCVQPQATPGVNGSDTLWIDDVLPGGANGSGIIWDTSQHVSGTQSLSTGPIAAGQHSFSIVDATTVQPVYIGEKLVFYVLLDMCSPPTEMLIRWKNTWGEIRGAYWGTAHGISGENTNFPRIGAMPSSGTWIRMEVPASQLIMEDRYLTSFYVDTWDGRAWFDGIGKGGVGCAPGVAPAPSIPAGDTVWIDDAAPSGSTVVGHFDATQHASGSASFHIQYNGAVDQTGSITSVPASLSIAFRENLVAYVLINSCAVPSELALKWHTTNGELRGVYWGTPHGWGEGSTLVNLGAMPAADAWQRVEIPASQLAIEQRNVDGFYFETYGGEVWVDHIGKSGTPCYVATAPAPSIPSGDVLWIEDSLPPGVPPAAVVWDTSQKASGAQSMTTPVISSGDHQIAVINSSNRISVGPGDTMVAYVLLNECAPPTEILLTWSTTTGTTAGAYWGTPHGLGEGTTYFSMGSLPAPGVWTRLEVSARQLGIEQQLVNTMKFDNVDGQVWWDHVGKVACSMGRAAAPSIPSGDTVWFEDGPPSGGGISGANYDSTQAASGTLSFSDAYAIGTHTVTFQPPSSQYFPVSFGETIVFYALFDSCGVTPSEIRLQLNTDRGEVVYAYWGTPHSEPSGAIAVGPLGAAGSWQRYEVSAAALHIEARSISYVRFVYYDGRTWFDHIGKGGTACNPPAPPAPAFGASDVVWVDDSVPAGSADVTWDTSEHASGTRSISAPFTYGSASHTFNIDMNQPEYIGDSLVLYALLDPCAPPTQVSAVVRDSTGSWFQAYWGTANGNEMAGAINMGPLPAAGTWQRLEVPFALWQNEERNIWTVAVGYTGGRAWLDRIGRNGLGCVLPHAAQPSMPSGDVVWAEDDVPASPGTVLDTSQAASGTKSIGTPYYEYAGRHQFGLGQFLQQLYIGDSLVAYILIDPCAPMPSQISAAGWADGHMVQAYWGAANGDEIAGAINMGPIPATPGVWYRLELPFSVWRIEGHVLDNLTLSNVGGHVWYDHVGRAGGCVPPRAAQPSIPTTDLVWADDDAPANPAQWFDPSQSASGAKSMSRPYEYEGRHAFGLGQFLQQVNIDDSLVAYILIDPCAPMPTQISASGWVDGRVAFAYWGTPNGDETADAVNMGPIPATPGVWYRLELPFSVWRIEGHVLDNLTLSNVGGHVWYDHIGHTGGCASPRAAQPSIPTTDLVWADDDAPANPAQWFDPSQSASGAKSMSRPYEYEGRHAFGLGQFLQQVNLNDSLVFYVLVDPCAPIPTQISASGWVDGRVAFAYWGTPNGDETADAVNMGPIPATPGAWYRFELPFSVWQIEGHRLDNLTLANVNGHVWYDHVGHTGGCVPTRAAQPSMPAGDVVWADDDNDNPTIPWDSSQSASGTRSISLPYQYNGRHWFGLGQIMQPIVSGDKVIFYALFDSCAPQPAQIAFSAWSDGGIVFAYWGTPNGDEPANAVSLGALPAANGTWQRFEVPASAIGIENQTLDTFNVSNVNGHVWYDHLGKSQ
ncbi:MAG TPA: hypothetical protein VI670_14160 [Thermoanaerobaculia bacterium]|jgi:hypothetical protein